MMYMSKQLTEKLIQRLSPGLKPYKTFIGGGLFLLVTPSGGRLWRYKFRFGGREKQLAIGRWPDISLREAKLLHQEARTLLAKGVDPAAAKRRAKESRRTSGSVSFQRLAAEWLIHHAKRVSPKRLRTLRRTLEKRCLPCLGALEAASLKAPVLLEWLHKLEASGVGAATVHLCKSTVKMVLDLAVAKGAIDTNPLENRGLSRQLTPMKVRHLPAPEKPEQVGHILKCLEDNNLPASWSPQTKAALRLLPYIATRPAEMLNMRWTDIDWRHREWRYVATKVDAPLIVPLSRQVLNILADLQPITGTYEYVFSSRSRAGRPLNAKGLPTILSKISGIPAGTIVPHGWRSVFSTLGQEECGFSLACIELQLGHKVKGPLGDTYNRAQFLAERRQMMQQWADYLDSLKAV